MIKQFWIACVGCVLALPALANESVGHVQQATGWVYAMRGENEQRLRNGDAVYRNDAIETRADSMLKIGFNDDTSLTMGERSNLTIDSFVYDSTSNAVESSFEVSKGFFRYIGGKAKKKASLTTPVSTLGIRGTEFFGEVKKDGETLVGLVECCVDVSSDAGTVALTKAGTFSKVVSKNTMPSEPIVCDVSWIEYTAAKLGATTKELGYDGE